MLSSTVISVILGGVLGFLTGLGTGGGSLLLLWLTLVLGMDPQTARTVNLMFFIPAREATQMTGTPKEINCSVVTNFCLCSYH